MRRIASWNVNGVRAAQKKGFRDWLVTTSYDVVFLQETKAQFEQLDEELVDIPGYHSFWKSAERKGYSGVAAYTATKPLEVHDLGVKEFDAEGRTCIVEFEEITMIGCYFPNSRDAGARLGYKLDYCNAIFEYCTGLSKKRRPYLICGDYNIAHRPIDLARPKANEGSAGYLPEEREWMQRFVDAGNLDTFRMFCDEPGNYTWWSYIRRARDRNVGWRLDYHCVPDYLREHVCSSEILSQVLGSDHCPVLITLDL